MAELSKSDIKRNALINATIKLVISNGFHATPMSKIAKEACISPGTIYLYYKNKQDLINNVYLHVKQKFTQAIFQNYTDTMSVEKSFKIIWYQIADYRLQKVEEALFLSHCDNTPIIDDESRKEGIKHLQPLLDLWQRGQDEGIIKKVCPYVLYAYAVYPLAFLINAKQRDDYELTEESKEQAFKMAWDSIKSR